jgi:DDE domain
VDETYVKVAGRWRYVYRAIDRFGQIIDVLVSMRRDASAARHCFQRAIGATKVAPVEVTTDKAPVYRATTSWRSRSREPAGSSCLRRAGLGDLIPGRAGLQHVASWRNEQRPMVRFLTDLLGREPSPAAGGVYLWRDALVTA